MLAASAALALAASATTTYYWGSTPNTDYIISSANSGPSTVAVGSRLPNNWGFFDMIGNVSEWCLDVARDVQPSTLPDAFTPTTGTENGRRNRGGAWNYSHSGTAYFKSSFRGSLSDDRWAQATSIGFRVALVVEK